MEGSGAVAGGCSSRRDRVRSTAVSRNGTQVAEHYLVIACGHDQANAFRPRTIHRGPATPRSERCWQASDCKPTRAVTRTNQTCHHQALAGGIGLPA